MASTSMYDMIMDLPLFKGVSRTHISDFLEKTALHFEKYTDGDIIVDYGDETDRLRFVIQGEVEIRYKVDGGRLILCGRSEHGTVIGADRMFGLVTDSIMEVKAVGTAGIMSLKKEDYITLLSTDNIYLLNYLNYLSMRAQRVQTSVSLMNVGSLESLIAAWIELLPTRKIKYFTLEISDTFSDTIYDIFSREEMESLRQRSLIEIESPRILRINR